MLFLRDFKSNTPPRGRGHKSKRDALCCRTNDGREEDKQRAAHRGRRVAAALGFCGCQARTVSDSKKNEVALSFLPQTWWLVVATDVCRTVLACLRLADKDGRVVLACVRLVEEGGGFTSASATTSEA